ncbi:MAG TPA: hypothetical protein VM287_16115 [Egibacteraceae bacterium]|nr:hypothetical protein [Egibacteraceae bacterium]
MDERKTVATKDAQAYQVAVERQKAAQAAGNYDLSDLPGQLAEPAAAARIGKTPKQDKILKGRRALTAVVKLAPGSALAVFGRPESRWAMAYWRRTGGGASMTELLSYARQLIGMNPSGGLVVCLCGHAGQGPCIPLWAPREEVSLTVQPNDLVLRFDDLVTDQ